MDLLSVKVGELHVVAFLTALKEIVVCLGQLPWDLACLNTMAIEQTAYPQSVL